MSKQGKIEKIKKYIMNEFYSLPIQKQKTNDGFIISLETGQSDYGPRAFGKGIDIKLMSAINPSMGDRSDFDPKYLLSPNFEKNFVRYELYINMINKIAKEWGVGPENLRTLVMYDMDEYFEYLYNEVNKIVDEYFM